MSGAFGLQGHRGARGLFAENTLAGFAGALAVGVHTIELDVAMTADDVLVVAHDPVLNPESDARAGRALASGRRPAAAQPALRRAASLRCRAGAARERQRRRIPGPACG